MQKPKVLFIINPISGGIDKSGFPETVKSVLSDSQLDVQCVYSERIGHAEELSRKAVADGFDLVFSVGGDGTMNEVARGILNTNVGLGLVPLGSGNGLARHMGLPLKIKDAISLAKKHSMLRIDSGSINNKPFFNMAGVGFDAHIGNMFATSKERGFKTYVINTITEFINYKPEKYKLVNGQTQEKTAFLISFANSSQYGNNAFIAPQANLQDGKIDVCVLKPFHPIFFPELSLRLFNKTINDSQFIESFKSDHITIEREKDGVIHLDGDPHMMGKSLEMKVNPSSLNILVPKK